MGKKRSFKEIDQSPVLSLKTKTKMETLDLKQNCTKSSTDKLIINSIKKKPSKRSRLNIQDKAINEDSTIISTSMIKKNKKCKKSKSNKKISSQFEKTENLNFDKLELNFSTNTRKNEIKELKIDQNKLNKTLLNCENNLTSKTPYKETVLKKNHVNSRCYYSTNKIETKPINVDVLTENSKKNNIESKEVQSTIKGKTKNLKIIEQFETKLKSLAKTFNKQNVR
jgi:hypothetical protein